LEFLVVSGAPSNCAPIDHPAEIQGSRKLDRPLRVLFGRIPLVVCVELGVPQLQ